MKVWLHKCWPERGFQVCGVGTARGRTVQQRQWWTMPGKLHCCHHLRALSMNSQTLSLKGGDKEVERWEENFQQSTKQRQSQSCKHRICWISKKTPYPIGSNLILIRGHSLEDKLTLSLCDSLIQQRLTFAFSFWCLSWTNSLEVNVYWEKVTFL